MVWKGGSGPVARLGLVLLLLGAPGLAGPEGPRGNLIEYRGRLLPKRLQGRLERWERKDARVAGWEDRYKLRTRHYKVETSLPRFVAELEVKPFLDELYDTFSDVFRDDFGLRGRGANGKTVLVFHGYRDYADLAKEGQTVQRSNPGFIRNGRELVVFYEDTDPATFYGTMFHEGAHQFVKNLLPGAQLPLWLDEALAVYFEGCRYSRRTGKIEVGHLPPDRLHDAQEALRDAVAAEGESLPETLFMNVPPGRFHGREYALAWSFVYYLAHCENGKYRKGFARFIRATNGAGVRPVHEVFEQATGHRLEDLQEGWRAYVLGLEAEPSPRWVVLDVSGEATGVDLRTEDRVWSIGGARVTSYEAFDAAWTNRAGDGPVEFVVVRRAADGTDSFVRTTVPAGCPLTIEGERSRRGSHNLVD
jgi:hypothetical protein